MREKMYEMIRLLVETALKDAGLLRNEREITALLTSRGFPQEDVYDAISWMQQAPGDRPEGGEAPWRERRGKAVRVMHPEEYLAFSPAAQGMLHRFYNEGLIDDYLREEIIQRCIDLTEEEIGLEEVKTVTLLVLLKEGREPSGETVSKILEGNQVRLSDS